MNADPTGVPRRVDLDTRILDTWDVVVKAWNTYKAATDEAHVAELRWRLALDEYHRAVAIYERDRVQAT